MKKYIFTCGDINGIGPEIVVKALNRIKIHKQNGFYFICPSGVFKRITAFVKPQFKFSITSSVRLSEPGTVTVIDPGKVKIQKGKATGYSGEMSYYAIEISFAMLKQGYADAVITAPISKTAINLAGVKYPGHTEMFAEWCNTENYAMTFLSRKMNAALATIHNPLKDTAKLITSKLLNKISGVILQALIVDLDISHPSVAVLGLNPHAGEKGIIGTEEKEIIIPFLNRKEIKKYFSGPYSPDAFFASRLYKNFDMILGMYHDQVLIPFKMLNFNAGVNYTAGLPVIRTSPDHGTAYDIAWKGIANESSILEAFNYADKILNNRRKNALR